MTKYDPEIHHRRSIRLAGYDYRQAGYYFVTICVRGKVCLFGDVVDGTMVLNAFGRVVAACWDAIPDHFPNAALDAFVVMPNHVHGIIVITDDPPAIANNEDENPVVGAQQRAADLESVRARHAVPQPQPTESFGKPVPGSLATIIRSFKSAATKRINHLRGAPGAPVWQRNYYEHVVRSERSLNDIRQYIQANPAQWSEDADNPANLR